MSKLSKVLDQVLHQATARAGGVPGVVAMVTDKNGIIYEGASGVRTLGESEAMTTDTVTALFSTTKAITGAALMQLVEEGKVKLTDAAKEYVPELADIKVLEGFDDNEQPILRDPKTDITIEMLMLHTAGFGYDFFNGDDQRYRKAKNIPSILTSTIEAYQTVLLFEPGTAWNYGTNIDWIGKIIENVRGCTLEEALRKHLFEPLEMNQTSFILTEEMEKRRASIHIRMENGQLVPQKEMVLPQPPSFQMGGAGLYGEVGDYMKFIRMILNDGENVLAKETVEKMASNGLGHLKSGGWKSFDPVSTNDGEFFPGIEKTWAYTFQRNEQPLPTGRPAGQLMWAGLANSYYWIDRENGIGGFFASQVLPFHDVASYLGYLEFESAVYSVLNQK